MELEGYDVASASSTDAPSYPGHAQLLEQDFTLRVLHELPATLEVD